MKNKISQILSLFNKGNVDLGLRDAKELYNANPNNIDIIKLMIYSYIQIGNFEKVIYLLEQSLRLKKDTTKDFDYNNNMGYALVQTEEFERAILYLNRALDLNNKFPGVYANIATVYQKRKDFLTAKKYIDNAINLVKTLGQGEYTKYTNIFLLFSEINSALKKDDETINFFDEILDKSFNENIFYIMSIVKSDSIKNNFIKEAYKRIENTDNFLNKVERFNFVTPIYFGLANYYENKEKEKSEKNYIQGNLEIFKSSRYNSHEYQQKILKIIDSYENTYFNYDEGDDSSGDKNFFIVGSPRSGTTLVESIITANDKVFSAGEMTSSKNLIERHIKNFSKDLYEFKYTYQTKYLNRTEYLKGNYEFIVDKMPENFLYIGHILKLLPNCKIILLLRDPWDTAISLFKQRYVLNIPYSASFFNIGVFLSNFEAIISYWLKKIKNKRGLIIIKYEDIVSDQQKSQKTLYEFCGLHNESYNDTIRKDFFSPTASIRQVKGKIHQKSVKKDEFTDKKTEFYESFAMQKKFWISKGILTEKDDFFGYFK